MSLFEKIRNFKLKKDYIEISDTGFYNKWRLWPFRASCWRSIEWDKVTEIYACMLDCYCSHQVALHFITDDSGFDYIYETDKEFKAIYEEVIKRFDGFNKNNFDLADDCFPWDIHLPCWHHEKKVEDLLVDKQSDRIEVRWKSDNSIYIQGED